MDGQYRIGLDIGIGSIGWAVISGRDASARIEDAGVRIFDSGESPNGKDRKSQQRRGFRSARRVNRRRHYRKERLKAFLEAKSFLAAQRITEYCGQSDEDVILLKVKALDEKLTKEQLAFCLIHTCNHRGYRDFYEQDEREDGDEETAKNKKAANDFDDIFKNSGCRTVSECLATRFMDEKTGRPEFRNRDSRGEYFIIRRKLMQDEIGRILEAQAPYTPELDQSAREMILRIIFSQRDFEDGPGNASLKFRRYTGFLDSLGRCPFYREDDRGFRGTVVADVFAVVNTLSQYRYIIKETGEYALPKQVAEKIIAHTLDRGGATLSDIKKLLAQDGILFVKSENSDDKALSKSFRFIKMAKIAIEASGLAWREFISEEQFDMEKPSRLHQIAEVLSKWQTPARRRRELYRLPFITKELCIQLSGRKTGGTAGAGYRYMCDAIHSFLDGDIYGIFQAKIIEARDKKIQTQENARRRTLRPDIFDEEIRDNPVVLRAVNETRKVVNAIINRYGSPERIIVEVADDLNRSFADRQLIRKRQNEREKENDKANSEIARLLNMSVEKVSSVQRDKYRLYKEQNGICLYSGNSLGDLKEVLEDTGRRYEVDHIIPYSLILDNTRNNKALVFGSQNQVKGQRTPLMYLSGEKGAEFTARVNEMFRKKIISEKKYGYLRTENLYTPEAEKMLSGWKSRNINDTRYITKYIVALLRDNLIFSGDAQSPVFGVKGGLTDKFRRLWLDQKTWGQEKKDRETYLNHAVDAVVVANLTPANIEIASDNLKLRQIYRRWNDKISYEYTDYLDRCVKKMTRYYGFASGYTRALLTDLNKVPTYIPGLREEVNIRFDEGDAERFEQRVRAFYKGHDDFAVRPHRIIASRKPERRYRGAIADSNPIKLRQIDGETRKITRIKVENMTAAQLSGLYTRDSDLISTLKRILSDQPDSYTVGKYMKEQGITAFKTDNGQPVFKVSVADRGRYTNYYKKDIGDGNYSILGKMKYYCVEVYKDFEDKTHTRGVRYVDIVHKDKKLYLKTSELPEDYARHSMYLFANDYIEVVNQDGSIRFAGYFCSVDTIGRSLFCGSTGNKPANKGSRFTIGKDTTVKKYDMSILGIKGGEVKCSAPLSSIPESGSK